MSVAPKCLGCGTAVRHSNPCARVLCEDCKRFAKLARYGTRCPDCRADDIVYTTESTGRETLFCSTCEYIWTRLPASGTKAVVLDNTSQRPWRGVERRFGGTWSAFDVAHKRWGVVNADSDDPAA
jgi:ribosomal protein S27E